MTRRRDRTPVVLDTNVFVRSFKSRNKQSANRRVIRLWLLEKRLQLIVSEEIIKEYLEIFAEILLMDEATISQWHVRFTEDGRSTLVSLGRRYTDSRDVDDNLMLATAHAGKAEFLITNDRDLLDLPHDVKRIFPFVILTPGAFLRDSA
jgi:putative PIN family toxin of toxin-antitoxin system